MACALHGKLETASVFHRKLREGGMTLSEYHLRRAQFEADSSNGLGSWLPPGTALVDSSIRRLGIFQPDLFQRSADTLHPASAADAGFEEIHSADEHLLTAAPFFGLTGFKLQGRVNRPASGLENPPSLRQPPRFPFAPSGPS